MSLRVVDLYCCQGGAAMGYHHAGATHIVGHDLAAQPRFPFVFVRGSALDLTVEYIRQFDFVHASPPCQGLTEMNNDKSRHLNLIPETRALLDAAGVPYVIENVRAARAHMINPVSLFGTMFDLHAVDSTGRRFDLSRERLFEVGGWDLSAPLDPGPRHPIANVIGGHFRVRGGDFRTGKGTGRTVDLPGEDRRALAMQLMGMPWATMSGMSEAVPPAFTHYIGQQFLAWRSRQRAAA
jgi:DNA (cytosine-5)-methyltransferase 1